MATNAELNYLRQALAQKRSNQANGTPTITQGESLTQMGDNNGNALENFWSGTFGFLDETAARFGKGFINGWEGVLDFGANLYSTITGDQRGSEWAKQDIGEAASQWVRTYANLNPWSIGSKIANGTYANGNYWGDMFSGLGDILGSGFFVDTNLNDYTNDTQKYYSWKTGYNTKAGEFIGEAAQTVGNMIPSIMVGNAVGGIAEGVGATAKGVQTASKVGSLSQLGLSAGGQGVSEALNEGATSKQATLYGLGKGAIEVASEIVVSPALDKIAEGTGLSKYVGKFANNVGGWSFVKDTVGKATVKEIAKSMVEEGTEEVFSEVFDPLLKSIYKGGESFKSYTDPNWYFGDVAKSFVSGAVMGGVMTGISRNSVKKKVGVKGLSIVDTLTEVTEKTEQAHKDYKNGKIDTAQYDSVMEECAKLTQDVVSNIDTLPEVNKKAILEMYKDPSTFADSIRAEARGTRYEKNGFSTYKIVNEDGRTYNIESIGNEAIFSPTTQDTNRALTTFINENIEADSVKVAKVDNEPMVITKSTANNLLDDGFTTQEISSIADKLNKGDFDSVDEMEHKGKALVQTDNGNYIVEYDNNNGYKEFKNARKTTKDTDEFKKAEKNSLYKKVDKYWQSNYDLIKKASSFATIDLSTINNALTTTLGLFDDYAFGHGTEITTKGGKTIKPDIKFEFGISNEDLVRKLGTAISNAQNIDEALDAMNKITDEAIDSSKLANELKEVSKGEYKGISENDVKALKEAMHEFNSYLLGKSRESTMHKVIAKFQNRVSTLKSMAREYKNRIKPTADLKMVKYKIADKYGEKATKIEGINEQTKLAHEGKTLLSPFYDLKSTETGFNGTEFGKSLQSVFDQYTDEESIWQNGKSQFDYIPEIADLMQTILNELPERGTMSAQCMNDILELNKVIQSRLKLLNERTTEWQTKSRAAQTETELQGKGKGFDKNKITGKLQEAIWKNGALINDPKVTISNMTGSEIVNQAVQDISAGVWLKTESVNGYHDKVSNLLREEFGFGDKTKNTFNEDSVNKSFNKVWGKEIEVDGHTITFKDAFWWYSQLSMKKYGDTEIVEKGEQVQESVNYLEAIEGFWYEGSDQKYHKIQYKEGIDKELVYKMNKVKDGFAKRLFDFFRSEYNGSLKTEYIKLERSLLGTDTNALMGEDTYFPKTTYTTDKSTGKPVVERSRGFINSHSRITNKGTRGIRSVDAMSYFDRYCDDLFTEMYVRPATRELNGIFNTSMDANGEFNYNSNFTADQKALVNQFVDQALGTIKPLRAGFLSKSMVAYTLANPKTFLVQTGSYYTSGVDIGTMFKHIGTINSQAVNLRGEFKEAFDKICEIDPEFKLRSKMNEAWAGNTNSDSNGTFDKVGKFFTMPINWADAFTLRKIAVATLIETRDSIGGNIKITDPKVIKIAAEKLRLRYQTQISSMPMDRSPLRYGVIPWGSKLWTPITINIARAYTGAAQGFVGWATRTFGDISKYSKFDIEGVKNTLSSHEKISTDINESIDKTKGDISHVEEELESFRYERDNGVSKDRYDELRNYINEDIETLKELKTQLDILNNTKAQNDGAIRGLQAQIKGYEQYVASGGTKKRMANVICGALLMGLFTTGLKELFDRILNRKEWNEFDAQQFSLNLCLNSSVNMIPVVRTFVSWVQGNDVQDPTYAAISQFSEFAQDISKFITNPSDYKALIRDGIYALGILTQVPTKTIWNYFNGIAGQINPSLAYETKSLFYNMSSNNSDIKEAVASGKHDLAITIVSKRTSDSVGEVSYDIKDEMVKLTVAGYSVIPTAISDKYTDIDGNDQTLSWTNQQKVKSYYSKANSQISKLVKQNYYKNLTDEQKAKVISAVYTAYKQGAYSKVLGDKYGGQTNKASVIAKSGYVGTANIIATAKILATLEATKTKSKKEVALSYINKLPLSKQDKMIALSLAGYSVDGDSLKNALRSKGISNADIKKFVGE